MFLRGFLGFGGKWDFMFIERDHGMKKLWDTAVENIQEVQHRASALSLAGAMELHPEPWKPIFYYIPEVTRSDNLPWQPCPQKNSVTHCDIQLKKSLCSNWNELLHEIFRNLLSFKRNWFHFSNLNFSVSFHLLYTSFKGFKLSWFQVKVGEAKSYLS